MTTELVSVAFSRLGQIDQEILALRHVEQRSNSEVAKSLHIDSTTASVLYIQAIRRLKEKIEAARSFQPFIATTVVTRVGAAGIANGS